LGYGRFHPIFVQGKRFWVCHCKFVLFEKYFSRNCPEITSPVYIQKLKREANLAKGFDSGVHQSSLSGFKLGFGRDWWEHSLTSLARIAFLAFFSIVFGCYRSGAKAAIRLIAVLQKSNALPMCFL
jgi:hypothetical protein